MAEIWVTGAVEELVDEAVLRRLLRDADLGCTAVYGKEGKANLLQRLAGFNEAARHASWCVLIDLDHDAPCAPEFMGKVLPAPASGMTLRVAVREIESWLLADRTSFASFLAVRTRDVPSDPDALDDPKRLVIELARRSRRRAITEDLVPRPGSGRSVSPAYTSRLIEFVTDRWRPQEAAERSHSLASCVAAIARLRGCG